MHVFILSPYLRSTVQSTPTNTNNDDFRTKIDSPLHPREYQVLSGLWFFMGYSKQTEYPFLSGCTELLLRQSNRARVSKAQRVQFAYPAKASDELAWKPQARVSWLSQYLGNGCRFLAQPNKKFNLYIVEKCACFYSIAVFAFYRTKYAYEHK